MSYEVEMEIGSVWRHMGTNTLDVVAKTTLSGITMESGRYLGYSEFWDYYEKPMTQETDKED